MTLEDFGRRNDEIRRTGEFGPDTASPLMASPGVLDLGEDTIASLVTDLMRFNAFSGDDGAHDFGELVTDDGVRVWFKIDSKEGDPNNRIFNLFLPTEY